ncbi:MAG: hypothetical protein Q8K70_05415 [Bacteroidota bacterium]|nr:hypothetical protein [Bacteroidota bacterium]
MRRNLALIVLSFFVLQAKAQELFLLTNPASNVPKNALIFRGMNSFFQRTIDNSISYHLMPEIEYGLSKKLMLITNGFISNERNKLNFEGASFLTQYRFYSNDEAKKHFRMAVWSRIALNNADIHQEEIELNGHNSGIRIGLTGTQLLHKTAISSTISFQQAIDNFNNKFPQNYSTQSVDYTLSLGQLVLPRTYKNFNQTNVNLMVEVLGQTHLTNGKSFLDITPVIQFIFKSKARLDIAYRRQLYSTMFRTQPNGIIINLQYSIFNVVKKK